MIGGTGMSFSLYQKLVKEEVDWISRGRLLQRMDAATGNERRPNWSTMLQDGFTSTDATVQSDNYGVAENKVHISVILYVKSTGFVRFLSNCFEQYCNVDMSTTTCNCDICLSAKNDVGTRSAQNAHRHTAVFCYENTTRYSSSRNFGAALTSSMAVASSEQSWCRNCNCVTRRCSVNWFLFFMCLTRFNTFLCFAHHSSIALQASCTHCHHHVPCSTDDRLLHDTTHRSNQLIFFNEN